MPPKQKDLEKKESSKKDSSKIVEKQKKIILKTAPFDPRFPNTNQTKNCYQNYLDYHRCQKVKGNSYSACDYFKEVYRTLCPNAWVEKWDTQIQEKRFPGKI